MPLDAPAILDSFDPTVLLILDLAGTFVFGLSGGIAGARARLDLFGVVTLAIVVGMAGGITRDVLIGIPPQTIRDWRYLAAGIAAGLVSFLAHRTLTRLERPILVFDAGGLALFCVTGASIGLDNQVGAATAIGLGVVTGVGGGALRDVLLREVPIVFRSGLYAVPALVGATAVVLVARGGQHHLAVPILGAALCFGIRLVGIHLGLNLPRVAAEPSS